MLSLANILYRAGEYDDALVIINLALEFSPNMVALHFTAGNIYATKVGERGVSPLEVRAGEGAGILWQSVSFENF